MKLSCCGSSSAGSSGGSSSGSVYLSGCVNKMRCKICDWAPGLPGSLLRPSLANEPLFTGPPEAKDWDPVSGTYQCTQCRSEPVQEPPEGLSEDHWKSIGDLHSEDLEGL